jgi:hypothetical protein
LLLINGLSGNKRAAMPQEGPLLHFLGGKYG